MVAVKYFLVVAPFFIQGVVSKAEEVAAETAALPEAPNNFDLPHFHHYHDYDGYYGGQPDYGVHHDHVHAQDKDYYAYNYYWDYANYDYDDPFLDYYGAVDDRFAYGDRNNPADTLQHVQEETAILNQLPWVYIVVPVVQIDVYYLNDDRTAIEDIEMQLPVETYMFEFGDFGMGHLDLGDWGLSDWYDDYYSADYEYNTMLDYEYDYAHRPPPADLYQTGDKLDDRTTLDYPGIDHDPFWVDWIFMVPPDDMMPVVR